MGYPDRVRAAIEEWYSANHPLGVRLTYQQRDALALRIIQRLDLVDTSKQEDR